MIICYEISNTLQFFTWPLKVDSLKGFLIIVIFNNFL